MASVKNAMHGVDYIFHAAALKQVPSCEFFPIEAVKTNVLGTENVLIGMYEEPEWIKDVGSTLNGFGAKELRNLQDRHMANSRLHIPLLFMADIVHGYKTGFPIPLAIGASFEPKLYELACEVAAREGAASGIHPVISWRPSRVYH